MIVFSGSYKSKLFKFLSIICFMFTGATAFAGDLGQVVTPEDIKKLENPTAKFVRHSLWVQGIEIKEVKSLKTEGKTRRIPEELVQAVNKNNKLIGF